MNYRNMEKKYLSYMAEVVLKRNGLYDEVMTILRENGMEVHELAGVEPNPRVSTARKGATICKEKEYRRHFSGRRRIGH